MNLTKEHRTVNAIFDSAVKYKEEKPSLRNRKEFSFQRTFKVGLVTYFMEIQENATVSFKIQDIDTKPEDEFIKLMTESYNNNFKENYELSLEEALRYRRDYLLGMGQDQVVGTGNSFKVFGTLIQAVKDFIAQYKPEYLMFTVNNPNQVNLYEKMIHQIKNIQRVMKKELYKRTVFQVYLRYR